MSTRRPDILARAHCPVRTRSASKGDNRRRSGAGHARCAASAERNWSSRWLALRVLIAATAPFLGPAALLTGTATLVGCRAAGPPLRPALDAPVWPPAPDIPRIRYIGELRGEESLGARETGLAALKKVLAGPRQRVNFLNPAAVAVQTTPGSTNPNDVVVFVADLGLGIVHRLDLAQRQYAALRGNPADPLKAPIDLTITQGKLLVIDRVRATTDIFDLSGAWTAAVRWPQMTAPVAIGAAAAGRIYVADVAAHAILAFETPGNPPRSIGQRGGAPGQFNFPTAVAPLANGDLAVVDAMNFRVQVLAPDGQVRTVFGARGDAAGNFARPRDVAADRAGHLYVVDNQFENVQVFDPAGQLLMAFGREGHGRGEFSLPAGICIDDHDRIWIADSYNRRVQVLQYLAEAGT